MIFEKMIDEILSLFVTSIASVIIYFYLSARFNRLDKEMKDVDENLRKVSKELEDHKVHIAEKYITKDDHEKDLNTLKESLKDYIRHGFEGVEKAIQGIHRRFDRFEDNFRRELNNKKDKDDK